MKFLAIICEFNPFHNGHKYLLERARAISDADAVLCIMSGNFTQRGDMCVVDKYARARHAISGGADCVIQLPAPFAVAPAEIFARGAIKILSRIPDVAFLAFGCENADAKALLSSAKLLANEPNEFKTILNDELDSGESYIKSYANAFRQCGGDKDILCKPNNILALEYTKAILKANADIKILPVERIGSGYNDGELKGNFSSSSAIRKHIDDNAIKNNVPQFVYDDLKLFNKQNNFDGALRLSLFKTSAQNLKRVYGCGEGLENKLKGLENLSVEAIVDGATSRRYSSSRIRRILCANALELYADRTEIFLNSPLYIKPLAVKKERADEILSALAKSAYPLITGAHPIAVGSYAAECFGRDAFELALYNHINGLDIKNYMLTV